MENVLFLSLSIFLPLGCKYLVILCWIWRVIGRDHWLGQSMGDSRHWSYYFSHLIGRCTCRRQMGCQTTASSSCYTYALCFGFPGWHFFTYRLW